MQKLMEPRGAAQGTATKPSGNTDRSHEAMLSRDSSQVSAQSNWIRDQLHQTPQSKPGC